MPLSTQYQTATSSEAAALLGLPFKATLAQVEGVNGNGSLVVMLQDGPGEAVTVWPLPYLVVAVGAEVWVAWFSGVPVVIGGLTGVTISAAEAALFAGQPPAYYLDRANHSSSQPASTISDLSAVTQATVGAMLADSDTITWQHSDPAGTISAAILPDSITTDLIDSNVVTNAQLTDMPTGTVKGRTVGAGTGDPQDLTATEVAALLDILGPYVRRDGSLGLTGDWNTGEDRRILVEALRARDNEGLRLEDDAGVLGVYIQDGGKVGIGTNQPDGSLVKTVGVIGNQGRAAFLLSPTQNSVGGTQYGLLAQSAGTDGGAGATHFFPFATHGGTLDNYRASFWVSSDLSRPGLNIGFANTVTAPVWGAIFNGNVGIGLSAPGALLHVGGDLMINDRFIFNSARAAFPTNTLNCIYATLDSGTAYPFLENNNVVIQARSSSGALRDIIFATGGTTPSVRMVISRAGNVGIGTDSPAALLHVVGANGLMRFQRDNGAAAIQLGTTGSLSDGGSVYALGTGLVGLRFLQAFGGTEMGRITPEGLAVSASAISPTISAGVGIDLNGSTIRLRTRRTLASAGAAGNAGEFCFDANFAYFCVATNTWKRVALSTW